MTGQKEKKAYTFTLWNHCMGVVRADNLQVAKREMLLEYGRANVTSVREATEEDIVWFQAMGGAINEV